MKGRLIVPYSLIWAVFVAAAGVGGSGCSSSDSATNLDPEGPPAVKQVFVNARNGNGLPFSDPTGSGNDVTIIDGGDLAYGLLPDVGQCTFDNMCPTARGFPSGYTCNTDSRLCVGADGKQTAPGGRSLLQDGIIFETAAGFPIIQIVFKELLDPATVEEFTCACATIVSTAANGDVSLVAGNCPGGKNFTTALDCGDCPDNPDTSDAEAGACFDINGDGVYDLPRLVPGLVSITCPGTGFSYTSGGVSCATVTTNGVPAAVAPSQCDGFYDPSGNQIITIDNGYLGLGPRLYIYPGFGAGGPLPADSDCELTVSNSIKDKDGLALVAPTPAVIWHTEAVQRIASTPEGAAVGDTPPQVTVPDTIQVNMNTLLNPTTVATDTITVTSEPEPQTTPPTAPSAVAGTTALDASDATLLVWTPAAPLAVDRKYTVTVATGIEDTFGTPLADNDVFVFVAIAATP